MRKLAIIALAVLFFAPAAMAKGWGVGAKLGISENEPTNMKHQHDNLGGELDKDYNFLSLEALHEWDLNGGANKIGFKAAWETHGESEFKPPLLGSKITEKTHSFPFTVYYKRDNGVKKFSWFAGAGVTIFRSTKKVSGIIDSHKGSAHKAAPHITVGGEYKFTEVLALGLEGRYNIGAKVKKNGEIFSDRTGFGAAFTCRFYF